MKLTFTRVLATTSLALALMSTAQAASFEGVHFDDSAKLSDTDLRLNGLGMRAVLWLKGYVAGLYLIEKASTAQSVYQLSGPKRIQMKMLVQATSADFRKALINGIHANVPQSDWPKLQSRIEQFELAINEVGTVKKGDTITLDFIPSRGLVVSLNNQAKGQAIAGADFFNAVLAIFLGNAPVDARLKSGLLGLSN